MATISSVARPQVDVFGRHGVTVTFAFGGATLIDVITDPDAKPPISFYAGHCPEPF
jgi:hypothetical protein